MSEKELLTVREFAKLARKTPQAIYQQLDKKLIKFVKVIDGQKMLEKSALKVVYGVDLIKVVKEIDQESKADFKEVDQESKEVDQEDLRAMIRFLEKQIEEKDRQLDVKDRQIAEKDRQINGFLQYLHQDQGLEFADKMAATAKAPDRDQDQSQTMQTVQTIEEPEQKRQPWWRRIFGR